MTTFIRFPDEATGMAALTAAGLYVEPIGNNPGYSRQADHNFALDVVGIITEGGTWDQETGEELVPPTVLEGWHVNYIGELPEGWKEYVVEPKRPRRVFA